jgi:hypothetical protein
LSGEADQPFRAQSLENQHVTTQLWLPGEIEVSDGGPESEDGRMIEAKSPDPRARSLAAATRITLTISEREKTRPTCPKCKGTKVTPQLSGFTAQTGKKS